MSIPSRNVDSTDTIAKTRFQMKILMKPSRRVGSVRIRV